MLTSDVFDSITLLQSIDCCINALLKGKLWSNMIQIFCTYGFILIGQIQLLVLWFTRQCIGHYFQQSLPVQYHNGQLIQHFKPMCLTSTEVWLYKYMIPWFVVRIYGSWYAINVISPLDTCLKNCQQLFLAPPIVAFHWSVLATMVHNGV